jgi:hypothetical protein
MAEALCRNHRGRLKGCQNVVIDGGVEDSGFCEDCFYPGIVEQNQQYQDLLDHGLSRSQAADFSGLNERDPHQVVGTPEDEDSPTIGALEHEDMKSESDQREHLGTMPITNVQQDSADAEESDEEEEEEHLIQRMLDQTEAENDRPEIPD